MPRYIDIEPFENQTGITSCCVQTFTQSENTVTVQNVKTSDIPTIDPESLRPHGRWIPVEEKLPDKDHDWVLVACEFVPEGGYGVPHVAELRNGVWYADCYDIPLEDAGVKVTHWMPLPDCPNCGAKMDGEEQHGQD